MPEEETGVVQCGWNDDSSSKFRHVLQMDTKSERSSEKQPEVLLALTTFNLLLHMLEE